MRDDRDPPVNPAPTAQPNRPQLGARPFAGGRPAPSSRPASGSPTPSRTPRPFVPRHASRPPDQGAERIETPRVPNPVPTVPIPAPIATPSARRTPRMLAALVDEEQVAIWPVDATQERPAPPAAHNEMAGAMTEWESLAEPATTDPFSSDAGSTADSAGLSMGTNAAHPAPDTPLDALETAPFSEALDASPRPVEDFVAQPTPAPTMQPAHALPTHAPPTPDPATETARVLEAIAERVRSGEIVVSRGQHAKGRGGDAAVLAAVLASLLGENGA